MMPQPTPATRPIRLLTADDHPLLREGIAAIIEGQPDMALVAEAANGHEAVEYFRAHRPDVTLMDIQMPEMNGIEATLAIRREFPDARIVMLTTYRGDVRALRAIQAGAAGYLLKSMLRKDLLDTVRAVRAGQRRIPAEIAQTLAEHVTHETLSEREIDVLRLVAQGGTNKRVAARLEITEDTVKAHMKNILGKLVATDRTHAVMIALKRGIIDFQ
ncbi:MAG TPA: response regulator transcription factor [Ideonella sp.]|nr:response regulator transcription factor [Ideonella sp.]